MSLDHVLGSWDIEVRHHAVPVPVAGRQHYERVLDGAFTMLTWTHEHPDFPDAVAMLGDRAFHYFDVRGVVRTFDLEVTGTGWSMIRRGDDFWQRSRLRFLSRDAMEGDGENSHDGGTTWQHDFSVTYTRAG
jgi:hypothetical protein